MYRSTVFVARGPVLVLTNPRGLVQKKWMMPTGELIAALPECAGISARATENQKIPTLVTAKFMILIFLPLKILY